MRYDSGHSGAFGYKQALAFIWHYTREKIVWVCTAMALVLLAVVFNALMPLYIGKMVDGFSGTAGVEGIWFALLMLVLLKACENIFRNAGMYVMRYCNTHFMSRVAADAAYKIQRFSSEWHENAFVGGTVRKVSRGMWALLGVGETLETALVPAVGVVLCIEVLLFFKVPMVAAVLAPLLAVYIAVNILVSIKVLRPRFRSFMRADTELSAEVSDVITGNPIVKSFGTETVEDQSIARRLETLTVRALSAWGMAALMNVFRNFIDTFIYGVTAAVTVWLWMQGKASTGDVVMVISALALLSSYLQNIGNSVANFERSINEMEDIVQVWRREDEIKEEPHAVPLDIGSGENGRFIEFNNVVFQYPRADTPLFTGLSVAIARGEHVALVGTSGSGKSTFIKLLQRLYNVESGSIAINGQDISGVTLESLRQSISLVPQDPILFHRSLRENIAYGKPGASMEEVIEAAKKACIHDFIATLPEGYETQVGERGVKLSGGERQRVAIARAILADKPVLVLDEATSSLDSVSEQYIKRAMEELTRGKTTITIAHRLSTVQKSDRILVFSAGQILEQGGHQELMDRRDSQYKKLYETQALGILIRDQEAAFS